MKGWLKVCKNQTFPDIFRHFKATKKVDPLRPTFAMRQPCPKIPETRPVKGCPVAVGLASQPIHVAQPGEWQILA